MIHQFERCCGVELLKDLHTESEKLKIKYDQFIANVNEQEYERLFGIPHCNAPNFEVVHGNILEQDWSASDLVFCNWVTWDTSLKKMIETQSKLMKKGSWFITAKEKLPECENLE